MINYYLIIFYCFIEIEYFGRDYNRTVDRDKLWASLDFPSWDLARIASGSSIIHGTGFITASV